MTPFKASETTLFFNTRDELVKVRLERVAYFEAICQSIGTPKIILTFFAIVSQFRK